MEKNKICLSEIKELIPHREPFLFIEELNNLSLDLVSKVEKSYIKVDKLFQYKMPNPI